MKTKELKIQAPEGYEIDREKSTFDCIKFKPIKKDITYRDVCNKLFVTNKYSFYIPDDGEIDETILDFRATDKNNATNREQLEKILALNQLLNIAEFYNKNTPEFNLRYRICYDSTDFCYKVATYAPYQYTFGVEALFNDKEDAQKVIDNPNFQEILDTVYKNKTINL